MGEVVSFNGGPVGDGIKVPIDGVIDGAREAGLTSIVVIGYAPNGEMYLAASDGGAESLVLLKIAERMIIDGYVGEA